MANLDDKTPVKALDGTIHPLEGAIPHIEVNGQAEHAAEHLSLPVRPRTDRKPTGRAPGALLSGKQEHYLKRELLAQQVAFEISELSSTTALQRFGAPFRSDRGEVAPIDSDLPLLRYIFVHHVRNFPFLDQAREKEFWQDKLQVFLESFASKHISSSEDRLEETKRRKLAVKAKKLVELMMVSGIPTASGYEERIRFSEIEVVDRQANDKGLQMNKPHGDFINGWDVNVAGVRTTSIKRTVRYHQHAEFLLTIRRSGRPEVVLGKRFGDFARLHKQLRTEIPGKIIPPLPRKNKADTSTLLGGKSSAGADDDDASSVSSMSTQNDAPSWFGWSHKRSTSTQSAASHRSIRNSPTPRNSGEISRVVKLYREDQRVSLRAFLRTLLSNQQIAETKTMEQFLAGPSVKLNDEEILDIEKRKVMDEKRLEEQRQFYEIARQRAKELDVYMEKFRRDVIESNGLTKLFGEIKTKATIPELSIEYQKFCEWLRIEVAATLYHLFLAEDNSPELFAQAKRIHSMVPYSALKQVIRFANPGLVMHGVLDLFLAQPFGSRSLAQRVFGMAIRDGISTFQKSIDALTIKIDDPVLTSKVRSFSDADEDLKNRLRNEAVVDQVDLMVAILRSEELQPQLSHEQIGKVFNAYVAWNNAVENVDDEMKQGAQLFAWLKQLLKLHTRQRDKSMMLSVIEEPVTLQLFRDLFTIFYEPLIRVYKSANVYNSVTDFATFADDAINVIDKCQRQDVAADPNQTVQSFIDLCARHEHNFYKFVHEVHIHDNGLFTQLMGWLEGILAFLREGPSSGGKLDMNALFQGGVETNVVDKDIAIREIDQLIIWQQERKRWHQDKTRQKMAAAGEDGTATAAQEMREDAPGQQAFTSNDFGLDADDLESLNYDSSDMSDEDEEEESMEPIAAERKRRAKHQKHLRRSAGEPQKPAVSEVSKLMSSFLVLLRNVLAD